MLILFFFFKQETSYVMRMSDWSSDVCSSDLGDGLLELLRQGHVAADHQVELLLAHQPVELERAHPGHVDFHDEARAGFLVLVILAVLAAVAASIGGASCRERVCQSV